ncbi:YdcF family protein [bacterium]|nr:YdcF family protein [bacterium]
MIFLEKKTLRKRIIFFIIFFLTFLLINYKFWLIQIGKYLVFQTALKPADAIVVLGGGEKERVFQGIKLFKKKYAKKIIFTGEKLEVPSLEEVHWAQLSKKEAMLNGIEERDIIIVLDSLSTYDDALLVKKVVKKYEFKSLIIVTDPYHVKRAFFVFKKRFKKSTVTLMFYPVQDSWFSANDWWTSEKGLVRVNNEYIKFIYYLCKGYI